MVGGWEEAACLPLEDALDLATTYLKTETVNALRHAQQCWYSALPLYANGGTPPKPPEMPDDEDD